jgi:hypothetical protein
MQDQPSPTAILELAIAQLSAAPASGDKAKFELRVTTSALQLVKRALELGPQSDAAELGRLGTLLGDGGDLEALNRKLSAAIREGSISLDTPGVIAHLRATAMEKLAVDQPSYSSYRRALETLEK